MTNVFKYEPNVKILAFTTEKAHVSGTLMKNIDFRLPNEILSLKDWAKSNVKTGDIFIGNHVIFVILRKHFNTKIKLEDVNKMLPKVAEELKNYELKTTNEDYPQIEDSLSKHLPNLKFYNTSAWGV